MTTAGAATGARSFLRSPHLAGAGGMLLWALTIIIARWARDFTPPIGLCFWRTVVGIAVLAMLAGGPALRSDWRILRRHLPSLFFLGFLLLIGGNIALFIGVQYTTAINAGLINALEPATIIAMAALLFRDPVSVREWAGVAICLAGTLILVTRADLGALATLQLNVGDLWVIGAVLSWSLYANWLRKMPRGLSRFGLVIGMLTAGAILNLPLYAWETLSGRPVLLNAETVTAIAILGVMSSAVGIALWNYAVAGLGPGPAGLYINLVPAYAVVLAIVLLGEELMTFHLIGIAVIAAGLYLAVFARRRATATG